MNRLYANLLERLTGADLGTVAAKLQALSDSG